MSKIRLGVLGGTFDPIHNGHLFAANEAAALLNLDQVIFVPTAESWQKAEFSDAKLRLKMTQLGIRGNKKFKISSVDIKRGGATYTVDTLADLQKKNPDAQLVFILGADAVAGMDSWKNAEQLGELAEFAAISRPGYSFEQPKSLKAPVVRLEIPALAISASEIRERVKANKPIEYLVPPAVAKFILKHRLYRGNK
jgi:nicotinate-nucleotide adenylyltransferase